MYLCACFAAAGWEYDIPARRTGRPPRYDPVSPAFAQFTAAGAPDSSWGEARGPGGGGGGGGTSTWAAEASFLHPPGVAPGDPRVGIVRNGGPAAASEHYLHFPRGAGAISRTISTTDSYFDRTSPVHS